MPAVRRVVQQRAEHAEATHDTWRQAWADGVIDAAERRAIDQMLTEIVRGQSHQIVEIDVVLAYLAGGEQARSNSDSRLNQLTRDAKRNNLIVLPTREEIERDPDEAA